MRLTRLFDDLASGRLPIKTPAPALRGCHADRLSQTHVDVFNRVITR